MNPHRTRVEKMCWKASLRVKEARAFLEKYKEVKESNDSWRYKLATHAFRLARLDPYYRAGYTGPELFKKDEEDTILELVELIKITPFSHWSKRSPIFLNAGFGEFSRLVKGADCDLIAGELLVELKAKKEATVDRQTIRQLLIYLLLVEFSNDVSPSTFPRIDFLQIYFARFGQVWAFPVEFIRQNERYEEIKKEVLSFIQRQAHASPFPSRCGRQG
jgi:hypothetical protein